jgi:hypothetical protein
MQVLYSIFFTIIFLSITPLQAGTKGFIEKSRRHVTYKFRQYQVGFPPTWAVISPANIQRILGANGGDLYLDPAYQGRSYARGWYTNVGTNHFATCLIFRQSVDSNFNLGVYVRAVLSQKKPPIPMLKKWRIKSHGSTTLKEGIKAKWVITAYRLNGVAFRQIDYYTKHGHHLHNLKFVVEAWKFSSLRHTFKSSAKSFVAH